jgi:hypothetical protein
MHTDIDKHERPYMKEELQKYLEHCRKKTRSKLKSLTDIEMLQPSPFAWVGVNNTELFIYNLRHMQHHIWTNELHPSARTGNRIILAVQSEG